MFVNHRRNIYLITVQDLKIILTSKGALLSSLLLLLAKQNYQPRQPSLPHEDIAPKYLKMGCLWYNSKLIFVYINCQYDIETIYHPNMTSLFVFSNLRYVQIDI